MFKQLNLSLTGKEQSIGYGEIFLFTPVEENANWMIKKITFAKVDTFPDEILKLIFELLNQAGLAKIALVSKKWNALSNPVRVKRLINTLSEPISVKINDVHLESLLKKYGKKLKCLNLRQIDDNQLIKLISYCPNLHQLIIPYNEMTGQGLALLKRPKTLQELDLSFCLKLTNVGLHSLNKLVSLRILNFWRSTSLMMT